MIKIENTQVVGLEAAIRGMRNPMNSWEKSDSDYRVVLGKKCDECGRYMLPDDDACNGCEINEIHLDGYTIGPNDHDLMMRLAKQGPVHGKFRRMIVAYMDITAPLYWWKEFDTYKVGTVANSCSTMHKIHSKEFTLDDFSHEHLAGPTKANLLHTIRLMNLYRDLFVNWDEKTDNTKNAMLAGIYQGGEYDKKDAWWQMIQLLHSSYNQRRTVMVSYEVLANIRQYRGNHKLDEWREFCRVIDDLPYSEIITCSLKGEDDV